MSILAMNLLHYSIGGPVLCMGGLPGSPCFFEDHRHLGPIVTDRAGNPKDDQPSCDDLFFEHYEAWKSQGKEVLSMGGIDWCQYKTRLQRLRARNKEAKKDAE